MNAPAFELERGHEAGGVIAGVAVGIVKANDDPQGLGRVKLSLPWRKSDFVTDWVRIVTPMGGDKRGCYFLPDVGDEVLVAFDRDDIRFPYVLGCLWSDKDKPPAKNANKKNDVKIVKTRKGHMLRFDDGAKGAITLELSDGKKVEIDDDGVRITDKNNKIEINSKKGDIVIEATGSLSLQAPTIKIKASNELQLDGGSSLKAKASMVEIN